MVLNSVVMKTMTGRSAMSAAETRKDARTDVTSEIQMPDDDTASLHQSITGAFMFNYNSQCPLSSIHALKKKVTSLDATFF